MATIVKRRKADGSIAYRADIRLKKAGRIIHQESKTFSRTALARDWARGREIELGKPGAIDRAKTGGASIGTLIQRYVAEYSTIGEWQRSKGADLKRLQKDPIALVDATTLSTPILVAHARRRRADGAGPATVLNDFVWLSVVLRTARIAWGMDVSNEVVSEARTECLRTKLIARSKERDRRPTPEELDKLTAYFRKRDKRATIPMGDMLWFAIHSTRRQAEICRIEWQDNDPATLTGVVLDLKHPREKHGNDQPFKYTNEAWAIVERQPRKSPYIFPYNPKSVGAAFTRACKMLGIKDLRFHDLRHEATSRLFEEGYSIQEVSMFTLHESWEELRKYANLSPRKLSLRTPVSDPAAGTPPTTGAIADGQAGASPAV